MGKEEWGGFKEGLEGDPPCLEELGCGDLGAEVPKRT